MSTHYMPTIAWSTLKKLREIIPSPDLQAEQWGPRERSSLAQGHEAELGKAKIGGLFHLATKWEGCNLLEGPRFRCFLRGGVPVWCPISCLQEGLVRWSPVESLNGLRTQLWYYFPVL